MSSVDGNISVVGQGGAGAANYNVGIDLYGSSQITATGSAKITITGTGGTGTDDNYGVRLTSSKHQFGDRRHRTERDGRRCDRLEPAWHLVRQFQPHHHRSRQFDP